MMKIPTVALGLFTIGCVIIGLVLIKFILNYLKTKPLGLETLLDGLYAQLFEYMAISGLSMITGNIFQFCTLKVKLEENVGTLVRDGWISMPAILSTILGWLIYTTFLVVALHLLACAIFRLILVTSQDLICDNDENILRKTRIGILFVTAIFDVLLVSMGYQPEAVARLQGNWETLPTNWVLKIRTFFSP